MHKCMWMFILLFDNECDISISTGRSILALIGVAYFAFITFTTSLL